MTIHSGHIVPGLPHILKPTLNKKYSELSQAMQKIGDDLAAAGVERILYYSTQWISVLGQSFQAGKNLKGTHVDENWHDLLDLPFDFKIDQAFARALSETAKADGYQVKLIDYTGFPVDTGTIVADTLINKGRFTTNMVSCCVYSDYNDTVKLTKALHKVALADKKKTAVVVVSMLSGRYFTTEMDLREDHISSPEDDKWNLKILELMKQGKYSEVENQLSQYNNACKVDMGFKALAVLKGMDLLKKPAVIQSYGPIYGTGNAVMTFQ